MEPIATRAGTEGFHFKLRDGSRKTARAEDDNWSPNRSQLHLKVSVPLGVTVLEALDGQQHARGLVPCHGRSDDHQITNHVLTALKAAHMNEARYGTFFDQTARV